MNGHKDTESQRHRVTKNINEVENLFNSERSA